MDFIKEMKSTLDNAKTLTENGAVSYRTTGKELLDLNFAVASLRSASEPEIVSKFTKAFFENKELAVKWLFFARDIREGLGERRLFRVCLRALALLDEDAVIRFLPYVSEYGRWDDLFSLMLDVPDIADDTICNKVSWLILEQLGKDEENMKVGKPISLLAKWMPSLNCSSKQRKNLAKRLCKYWNMPEKQYRQALSALRKYLNIVEQKMCANEWDKIDYSAVPSKANLIYRDAFMKHDEARRTEYLGKLQKGKVKINSSVAFPHDIVNKYPKERDYHSWQTIINKEDITLEEMWEALPDLVRGCGNTIVVADGSGSMTIGVDPKSQTTALDVANALAIYFAERSSGEFKDKYITFSDSPQLVDLSQGKTLRDKLNIAYAHDEISDTNIEATFDLILETAIRSNATQEDIPANVLIISDMEFNSATCYDRPNKTLFQTIEQKFNEAGYKMPRLVFWNVDSRTNTIPVKENELGVALVSGFSVNVVKMVMSGKLDPYEVLVEQLMSPRYECITLK